MQEARDVDPRLLSGEGLQPNTGDPTVITSRSAKKFPCYLHLLPSAEIDSAHLLPEPISRPQLPEPNAESYARYLQLQKYTSVEARVERVMKRAGERLTDDLKTGGMFALAISIVSACVIEQWVNETFIHRKKRHSHLQPPSIRY